ncbi:MAG: acyl-CoA dehydrogenase family protein, partial [Pseudomonas sp.]
MNFALDAELLALQAKVRRFIAEEIVPMERDPRQTAHGPNAELRQALVEKARAHGLLTPHASTEMGGLGLSHMEKAVIFEEAAYSPLGPIALNIHAPDEGNIHLLELVATPAQKQRWLLPMVQGHIRSCFAMTEPSPGAGSDPSMMTTTAVRDGDDYLINGQKWFITGAEGASVAIIMARMEDGSATMFLTDTDRPGFILERMMDSLDSCFSGGHAVLRFDNLRIPASDV